MDPEVCLATLLAWGDLDGEREAVGPSIHQGVNYPFRDAEAFATASEASNPPRYYRRYGNPTQARLERLIAAAENRSAVEPPEAAGSGSSLDDPPGSVAALATASGMGAVSTTLSALLSAGDHVVAQRSMYGGTLGALRMLADRFAVDVTFVDQVEPVAFEAACTDRTRLIMMETPSNPTLAITDLSAVAAMARARGILTWADNTVATPVNQRPLALGVDIVMHSLTKAISGHADVLGGALVAAPELIDRLWSAHVLVGAVISPFDAWLTLRGMRTLALRADRHNRSAQAVAEYLAGDPRIKAVNYPGLPSHPQHGLAREQMHGYGGLLSFEVRGGRPVAEAVMDSVQLGSRAASLGGTTTTVIRPAGLWTKKLTPAQLIEAGVPGGLIRLAVGLEDPTDLIADLDRALGIACSAG